MDIKDEFGDLYADIGPGIGKYSGTRPSVGESDLDVEDLLCGRYSSALVALSPNPPWLPAGIPRRSDTKSALAPMELDRDELLYDQLYGVSTEKTFKPDGAPLAVVENDSASFKGGMFEGFGQRGVCSDSNTFTLDKKLLVNEGPRQLHSPPGPSNGGHIHEDFIAEEEDGGQDLQEWDGGLPEEVEERIEGDVEDTDDEDDIQVVLNDETSTGEDDGKKEKGSTGGQGTSSGVPHIRYSGQEYNAYDEYLRPEVGNSSGMASLPKQGPAQAGVSNGSSTVPGGSLSGWGSGKRLPDRVDWAVGEGRGSASQSSFQGSGVMASWSHPRGFFLPPTKTVFDLDLDSLPENPWRAPGVDITDYFNFNFTENSWKQYCRALAQLRLESRNQRKIPVHESGRYEQEHDPAYPPELAARSGRGRGLINGLMIPTGGWTIPIQGGDGERKPSADLSPQRFRDSDVIVVLQDCTFENEPRLSGPVNDDRTMESEEEENQGSARPEKECSFCRPWELEDTGSNICEKENMPMGLGPIMRKTMSSHGAILKPGNCMNVVGPDFFPVGPGMPMFQPGPYSCFGMFPGSSFPPPSAGWTGEVWPPLHVAQRPGLSLQFPGQPPEGFPHLMVPRDYPEPTHLETPPHLTSPRITPPQGLPMDFHDNLSDSSGSISSSNWNSKEGRSCGERRELHGANGDWHADFQIQRGECNYGGRRGREIDQVYHRKRCIMDETSREDYLKLEEQSDSSSSEFQPEDNDWDKWIYQKECK